jgi:hypothetical protein
MPTARSFLKAARASFIQAALAVGVYAAPALAQDAQTPLDPLLADLFRHPRFDPSIIGITSRQNVIHNPNIGDDGAPGPKPDDTYLEIVVTEKGTLMRLSGSLTLMHMGYTPYAFFLHMDKNGCSESQYNSLQLARSNNPDAPRARQDLDALLEYYRLDPDAADNPKPIHREVDCKPISRLRLLEAGNG